MNTTILKKCAEELKKESPSIPYVLGMLETIIEMNQPQVAHNTYEPIIYTGTPLVARTEMVADEARTTEGDIIPDFLRPGPVAKSTGN